MQLLLFLHQGNVLRQNDVSGALCISQAWPGMARTIYNDHQRFVETYLMPYPGTALLEKGGMRTWCRYGCGLVGRILLALCMQGLVELEQGLKCRSLFSVTYCTADLL